MLHSRINGHQWCTCHTTHHTPKDHNFNSHTHSIKWSHLLPWLSHFGTSIFTGSVQDLSSLPYSLLWIATVLATFPHNWHFFFLPFTSASTGTQIWHSEDGSSMSLWNVIKLYYAKVVSFLVIIWGTPAMEAWRQACPLHMSVQRYVASSVKVSLMQAYSCLN